MRSLHFIAIEYVAPALASTVLLLLSKPCHGLSSPSLGEIRTAAHHLWEGFPSTLAKTTTNSVEDLANLRIPRLDGGTLLAYQAEGEKNDNGNDDDDSDKKLLLLLHEFFGLSSSICDKADALARDLGCTVIAPDTFRGQTSTFIPKCIWLALSTPQERVNSDLDDVLHYYYNEPQKQATNNPGKSTSLAVMGFCYGGGKAIRYTCECQPAACTVVCYGSPVTDVELLSRLTKPVCGVFGKQDVQFPPPVLEAFRKGLEQANIPNCDIRVYDNVGHAFWKDMDQIANKEQPQLDAYQQVISFLKEHL